MHGINYWSGFLTNKENTLKPWQWGKSLHPVTNVCEGSLKHKLILRLRPFCWNCCDKVLISSSDDRDDCTNKTTLGHQCGLVLCRLKLYFGGILQHIVNFVVHCVRIDSCILSDTDTGVWLKFILYQQTPRGPLRTVSLLVNSWKLTCLTTKCT